jgi:hypothetical protein
MLHDGHNNDRLNIAITYGDTRVLLDLTVAATCRKNTQRAVDKIEPGCATEHAFKKKTLKYKQRVEAQSKELQIVAFDSAGCPHPKTRTYLERWIKAATLEMDESFCLSPLSYSACRIVWLSRPFARRLSFEPAYGRRINNAPFSPRMSYSTKAQC